MNKKIQKQICNGLAAVCRDLKEEIAIEKVTSMVVANMSLRRLVNLDDVKYAVREGFRAGKNYEHERFDADNEQDAENELTYPDKEMGRSQETKEDK